MTNESKETQPCENCFGKGTIMEARPAKWGYPIDVSPPPLCPICKGTGLKTKGS
ncbi:hypothetical protein [Bradyrhizobium sp. Ash2021]|uniref:hypothetical protein n=1 Tax=Bradyrhizobium sp. Ash2021 TaxID=2954771 RepID=UPI002815CE25|nr:hypothetical protein [Bradyrhizobium sp. Ash2021]WMT79469.1 hypothetical protein NL528_46260 [Bradyrhizobium sp. Ash2021]